MNRCVSVALMFFVVLVVATLVNSIYPDIRKQQKISTTKETVRAWVEKLAGDKVESGTYKRWPDSFLPALDAWGNQLVVMYQKEGDFEKVIVASAGPDGELDTDDDIVVFARTGYRKAAGKMASEAIEEGGRHLAKGLLRGLKEEFQSKQKKK